MVLDAVKDLTAYGISRHLIEPEDAVYAGNQLLDVMKLEPPADFTIEGGNGSRPLEEILKELLDDAVARGIIEDGIALIAVVGEGIIRHVGFAAKLFGLVAEAGINVRMIDVGFSEMNVIIGVNEEDFEKTIRVIHQGLVAK